MESCSTQGEASMSKARQEAIEVADAQVNNFGMPTYSELLDIVKRAAYVLAEGRDARDPQARAVQRKAVEAIKKADPAYYGLAAD